MTTAYVTPASSSVRKASALQLSPDLAAVLLFSLLGLAVSAAVMTWTGVDSLASFLGAF